jgi:geranylgeranyl pyrophosphate synthase
VSSAHSFSSLKASIDTALAASLPDSSNLAPRLLESMRYALLGGGKRLRPMFTCVVGESLGSPLSLLLPAACAIEMVHAYSLVHDDLPAMDNDDLRHGKPTVHIAFGEWMAILAGDALLTLAFETISRMQEVDPGVANACTACLATASGWAGMVGGQTFDMSLADHGATTADIEALKSLHAAKTGALIRASVELGATVASADNATLSALRNFANGVGLAFQIMDDVLDVTASTEVLGKPAGSDIRENKQTFVSYFGVEGARLEAERTLNKALANLEGLPLKDDRLHALATLAVKRTF